MKRYNRTLLYGAFFNLIFGVSVLVALRGDIHWKVAAMFAGFGLLHLVGSFLYLSAIIRSLEHRITVLEVSNSGSESRPIDQNFD